MLMLDVTGFVTKLRVRLVCPPGTEVLDGRTTNPGAPETNKMLYPAVGALAFSVTVREPEVPPWIEFEAKENVVSSGAFTAMNTVFVTVPRVAEITTPVFAATG